MIERDSGKLSEAFSILRYTQYWGSDDTELQFNTSRNGIFSSTQWAHNEYEPFRYFSGSCEQECNSQNVSLRVGYRNKRDNSMLYLLEKVTYLYKNCDKLYWTNWIETTNCSLSRHRDYVRYCEDCDGDEVDEKHCDGNSTMHEDYQYFWSSWIEGDCVVTGCNPTVSERVRTRKCLNGDGKEATHSKLCSNQSIAIMKDQCISMKLPSDCEQFSSNNSNNAGVYIGVCVGLLFILLVSLVYCGWKKKKQNIADSNKHSSTNIPIDIKHQVDNQIQHNTNRDGYLIPLETSTLPNDNRQPVIKQQAPSNHPAQPNNKPSTSNQIARHLPPKMAASSFLQHGQSSPVDDYEAPISVCGQGPRMESAPGSTSYVNIHTLSPLDVYEVPMKHVAKVLSENPQPADNAGYVVFEAINKK